MMADAEFTQVAIAQIPRNQIFSFNVCPLEGRLMSALTIGRQLVALHGLFKAVGKDIDPNVKWDCFITKLAREDDGKISVEIAVMQVEVERAPAAAEKGNGQ